MKIYGAAFESAGEELLFRMTLHIPYDVVDHDQSYWKDNSKIVTYYDSLEHLLFGCSGIELLLEKCW